MNFPGLARIQATTSPKSLPGMELCTISMFAVVRRINAALNDALQDPGVRAAYARVGADPAEPNTPEQFAERARVDAERWGGLIRKLNLVAE